jgi:hypothetical protein
MSSVSMVEDANVDSTDHEQQTALHYAYWWPDIPVGLFKTILRRTTSINENDQFGRTALILWL